MIRKVCQVNLLHAVNVGTNGPCVSHLFFADDSIFFLKATLANCEIFSDIIHSYCCASGQRVNKNKSSLYFSPNTHHPIVHLLSYILSMNVVFDPGKYLGLPTVWGRSKSAALGYVNDQILRKINGWKSGSLSYAAKEVLIKAVAATIPAYPMSCFKFPKTLCAQITSALAKF